MSVFKRIVAVTVICFAAAAIVTCGLMYGWGVPIVTVRKTQTLLGPDNKVYLLLMDVAPYDEIMSAAKSDLAGTLSFCNNGDTLLGVAVQERRVDIVEGLLDLGMSPNSPGGRAGSPFNPPLVTAVSLQRTEAVKLLLEHGADPRLRGMFGLSAEDMAKGRSAEVKALIDAALRSSSRPSNRGR